MDAKSKNKRFYFGAWSQEKTAKLKEMWWAGDEADAIADALGCPNARSVSRKVYREGFERNPAYEAQMAERAVALEKAAKEPTAELRDGAPITLENALPKDCRWIAGEPTAEAQICGQQIKRVGQWWCDDHWVKGHVKQPASAPC